MDNAEKGIVAYLCRQKLSTILFRKKLGLDPEVPAIITGNGAIDFSSIDDNIMDLLKNLAEANGWNIEHFVFDLSFFLSDTYEEPVLVDDDAEDEWLDMFTDYNPDIWEHDASIWLYFIRNMMSYNGGLINDIHDGIKLSAVIPYSESKIEQMRKDAENFFQNTYLNHSQILQSGFECTLITDGKACINIFLLKNLFYPSGMNASVDSYSYGFNMDALEDYVRLLSH